MQRDSLRYLMLVLLLASAAGASVAVTHLRRAPRPQPRSGTAGLYSVHVDIAGWYEATANERVLAGPYDLRSSALPASLPLELGAWQGTPLADSGDVEALFSHPDVVVRREYRDRDGHAIWLLAVGSRGPKSFAIFEHTPLICYPSSGWAIEADDTARVNVGNGAVVLRRGVFSQGSERQVVYSWYQWDDPARDAAKGVTSWRLTAEAADGMESAEERLAGFLGLLFQEVLPWHRF